MYGKFLSDLNPLFHSSHILNFDHDLADFEKYKKVYFERMVCHLYLHIRFVRLLSGVVTLIPATHPTFPFPFKQKRYSTSSLPVTRSETLANQTF